tara:strand:+ start:709 stop:1077 length:369 start_codon:yes stop_codon:yes gene_type:complete
MKHIVEQWITEEEEVEKKVAQAVAPCYLSVVNGVESEEEYWKRIEEQAETNWNPSSYVREMVEYKKQRRDFERKYVERPLAEGETMTMPTRKKKNINVNIEEARKISLREQRENDSREIEVG